MTRKIYDQVRACIKTVVWHKDQRNRFTQRDAEPYLPEPEPPLDDDPERAAALKKRQIALMHKMPFSIRPPDIMQLAQEDPHKNVYTLNGDYMLTKTDQPAFIIEGRSQLKGIIDPVAFSREQLKILQLYIGQMEVKEEKPIQIDGLDGYELTAITKQRSTNEEVFIYQVTLFEEKAVYIMQGIVPSANAAEYGNMLRDITKSFRQTTSPNHF